jgi:hypothetical protein
VLQEKEWFGSAVVRKAATRLVSETGEEEVAPQVALYTEPQVALYTEPQVALYTAPI